MNPKKIEYFFDIAVALLLFSLPFSLAIPNIILAVILILSFFKDKKKLGSNTYINLLAFFSSYLLLKAFLENSFINNFDIYKHLFTILLVSFLLFQVKNIFLVIKGFIFGVFLAVLISSIKIFIFYLAYNQLPFGNTSEVDNLILIERPYFGFICFLTIVLLHFLIKKTQESIHKYIYLFLIICAVLFLFMIVARLALFLSFSFIAIQLFLDLKFSKIKLLMGFLLLTTISLSVLFLNQNIKNRFHIKDSFEGTVKVLKNQEPRFVIWECSRNQLEDTSFHYFTGYKNRADIQFNLNECFKSSIINSSKRKYYLETKFNTHNQFLDIFLSGGFIGIVLFTLTLIWVFYSFRNNFSAFFMLFGLVGFLLVENLFFRQLGAYLFGIFIPLFYGVIRAHNKEDEIR